MLLEDLTNGLTCFVRQNILVKEALENEEIVGGRGLNQETNTKLSANTCWSSHFATLVTLMNSSVLMFLKC